MDRLIIRVNATRNNHPDKEKIKMVRYLYSELAMLIQARRNCDAKRLNGGAQTDTSRNANEWFAHHENRILDLVSDHMPSGSGFDHGTQIDLDASHAEKLIFNTAFHHMDDNGFY